MTDLYGIRTGTAKVCAELVSAVLEVKFRRIKEDRPGAGWYVAKDDQGEALFILANRGSSGEPLVSHARDYDLLFYIKETKRPAVVARKIASETTFRYLEPSEKLRTTVADAMNALDRARESSNEST